MPYHFNCRPNCCFGFVEQHDLNTVLIAFMISFFPIAVSIPSAYPRLSQNTGISCAPGASLWLSSGKLLCPKRCRVRGAQSRCHAGLHWYELNEIVSPHGKGLGLFLTVVRQVNYPLMFAVLIALAILGIALFYVVVFWRKYSLDGPKKGLLDVYIHKK